VHDGVDYGFTGMVRRIDNQAIRHWLDNDAIVLLSSLGYSPTGETFNIRAEEVATAIAASLRADKLLLLYEGADLFDADGDLIHEMSPSDARHILDDGSVLDKGIRRHLEQALRACKAGVRRVHLIKRTLNGGLLLELFTRDGVGSMIAADLYEGLRPATIDDVGGLLELLQPLEEAGILVRRSRELLETEIGRFIALERDGAIIGCASLYPFPEEAVGELACVAIAPDYRNGGRADSLLRYIEKNARQQHLRRLFVLTTQTAHWFVERGFEPAEIGDLPVQKQNMYNWQRRSKVFIKTL
jgi:amino-acid N-acetyltransferase